MPLRLVDFSAAAARPIDRYASAGASSVELAHGTGESHAYAVHVTPGGVIGPHPAGFDQLFLVVQGSGWVAGADGVRHTVDAHRGAFVTAGEIHAKGSASGMVAVMIQASRFDVPSIHFSGEPDA